MKTHAHEMHVSRGVLPQTFSQSYCTYSEMLSAMEKLFLFKTVKTVCIQDLCKFNVYAIDCYQGDVSSIIVACEC